MNKRTYLAGILCILTIACKNTETDAFSFSQTSASVISSGSPGEPMFFSDPGVIKDSSGYHIFTLAQYCDNDGDEIFEAGDGDFTPTVWNDCFHAQHRESGSTLYAFSGDQGATWQIRPTPVLEASRNNAEWDEEKIETPFPLLVDDTLYLFYSATGVHSQTGFLASRWSIGVATLELAGRSIKEALFDNAEVFTKNPANPILEYNATKSDYDNSMAEPSVLYRNNKFELFATGLRVPNAATDTGASINGIALHKIVMDMNTNVESSEISNFMDMSDPDPEQAVLPLNISEVHYISDRYYAFYTFFGGGEFHAQETIKMASSPDGLNWANDSTILSYGGNITDSDGWGIMAPTLVVETDQLVMFYSAWGEVDNFLCDRNSKWGIDLLESSRCVYGSIARATAPLSLE